MAGQTTSGINNAHDNVQQPWHKIIAIVHDEHTAGVQLGKIGCIASKRKTWGRRTRKTRVGYTICNEPIERFEEQNSERCAWLVRRCTNKLQRSRQYASLTYCGSYGPTHQKINHSESTRGREGVAFLIGKLGKRHEALLQRVQEDETAKLESLTRDVSGESAESIAPMARRVGSAWTPSWM